MNIVYIDSLFLPELEPYRTMRRPVEHRAKGIFVAEGEKVVRRLLESELRTVSILMSPEWLERYRDILSIKMIKQGVFIAEKALLDQIVGYNLHQGIMAIGRVPEPLDIFKAVEEFPKPCLLVAADGIANSENMGVIVRNCAAFGVQLLISGETSCDPYLRRSVRNSMGTIFNLPVANVEDLSVTLKRLRKQLSFEIVAAHPQSDSIELNEANLTKDDCVVFGSEGEGISRNVLNECTVRVKIPMDNDVDSINVASSVGVVLYAVSRQRKKFVEI